MKFATRRHVSRRVVADCLQIDHYYSETDLRGSSDYTATRSTSAPAGSVRRAGGDRRSRRGRRRSAIEARAGRVGWACGSRRMGLRVASDGPAGRVGRSCCTANRVEEGNAARMRREERLDRQGRAVERGRMRKLQTGRHDQGRGGRSGGQRIGECSASRTEDKGGVCSIWDLTQHSPAQSRDAA